MVVWTGPTIRSGEGNNVVVVDVLADGDSSAVTYEWKVGDAQWETGGGALTLLANVHGGHDIRVRALSGSDQSPESPPLSVPKVTSYGDATPIYAFNQTASNNNAPTMYGQHNAEQFVWSAQDLPSGMDIDARTGVLTGAPAQVGTFNVHVNAHIGGYVEYGPDPEILNTDFFSQTGLVWFDCFDANGNWAAPYGVFWIEFYNGILYTAGSGWDTANFKTNDLSYSFDGNGMTIRISHGAETAAINGVEIASIRHNKDSPRWHDTPMLPTWPSVFASLEYNNVVSITVPNPDPTPPSLDDLQVTNLGVSAPYSSAQLMLSVDEFCTVYAICQNAGLPPPVVADVKANGAQRFMFETTNSPGTVDFHTPSITSSSSLGGQFRFVDANGNEIDTNCHMEYFEAHNRFYLYGANWQNTNGNFNNTTLGVTTHTLDTNGLDIHFSVSTSDDVLVVNGHEVDRIVFNGTRVLHRSLPFTFNALDMGTPYTVYVVGEDDADDVDGVGTPNTSAVASSTFTTLPPPQPTLTMSATPGETQVTVSGTIDYPARLYYSVRPATDAPKTAAALKQGTFATQTATPSFTVANLTNDTAHVVDMLVVHSPSGVESNVESVAFDTLPPAAVADMRLQFQGLLVTGGKSAAELEAQSGRTQLSSDKARAASETTDVQLRSQYLRESLLASKVDMVEYRTSGDTNKTPAQRTMEVRGALQTVLKLGLDSLGARNADAGVTNRRTMMFEGAKEVLMAYKPALGSVQAYLRDDFVVGEGVSVLRASMAEVSWYAALDVHEWIVVEDTSVAVSDSATSPAFLIVKTSSTKYELYSGTVSAEGEPVAFTHGGTTSTWGSAGNSGGAWQPGLDPMQRITNASGDAEHDMGTAFVYRGSGVLANYRFVAAFGDSGGGGSGSASASGDPYIRPMLSSW